MYITLWFAWADFACNKSVRLLMDKFVELWELFSVVPMVQRCEKSALDSSSGIDKFLRDSILTQCLQQTICQVVTDFLAMPDTKKVIVAAVDIIEKLPPKVAVLILQNGVLDKISGAATKANVGFGVGGVA